MRGQLAMKASTEAASSAPGVATAKTSSLVRLTLQQIESFEQELGLFFKLSPLLLACFWELLTILMAALAG